MKKTKHIYSRSLLLFLFGTQLSPAAVTLDTFTGAQAAASTGLSWSHTIGSGSDRALVVAIGYEDTTANNPLPTSVTYGSQTLTFVGSVEMNNTSFENIVTLWHLASPTVGTGTITVSGLTLDGPSNSVKGHAGSFFGVGSLAGFTSATGAGGTTTLSFASLVSGSAVFAAANNSAATSSFSSAELSLPLLPLTGGGSTSTAGYELGLVGNDTVSFAGPTGGRTPVLGVALVPVPEPSSSILAVIGLGGMVFRRKRA